MSFLKAEWRKLAIVIYEIDPNLLSQYLPPKTVLDLWNDTCYVSLVGFMFLNTKLLNVPIPFHRIFEEVNLRFYVKHFDGSEWKRGVVFIKEIVPKPALTFVANKVYKEHYETMKMSHKWELQDQLTVEYSFGKKNDWNSFSLICENDHVEIPEGSETEFITEHYWGYTKASANSTYEYEVTHPKWRAYPVLSHKISVNFGKVYGDEFALLGNEKPKSVMLAEGSAITVEGKRKL